MNYLIYAIIGFIEWFLALSRTLCTLRGWKLAVAFTVFTENLVGLLVFKTFIEKNDWVIAVTYSLGSAAGSILPFYIKWMRR